MSVTRIPYGLSFVKPGVASGQYTFTAGDVTPSVKQGTYFVTGASSLTLTNFDDGERGQVIALRCNTGGAVTVQNSAGGINIVTTQLNIVANSAATITTGGNAVLLNGEVAWWSVSCVEVSWKHCCRYHISPHHADSFQDHSHSF